MISKQNKTKSPKDKTKPEQNIQKLWENDKRSYINVIGMPEGEERGKGEVFLIIMGVNFPKLTPDHRFRRLRKHLACEIPRNLHLCTVDP